jgi:hypothetical protein
MHPTRQDSSQLDITIIKPSLLLIFVVDGTKIRGMLRRVLKLQSCKEGGKMKSPS